MDSDPLELDDFHAVYREATGFFYFVDPIRDETTSVLTSREMQDLCDWALAILSKEGQD